ncbi:hypothetical protein BT69DRAFT_1303714 [Atractiella rhizophila]|nr:hypothetical protein BT69DRAFT_1303714 [Atractiella rhizophila]
MDFADTELTDPQLLASELQGFMNKIDVSLQIESICRNLYETGNPCQVRDHPHGEKPDSLAFYLLRDGMRMAMEVEYSNSIQELPLTHDPHSKRIRSYPNRPGWFTLSQKREDTFIKVEIQSGTKTRLEIVPAITAARTDPSQLIILPQAKYPTVWKDGVEVLLDRDWTEWVKGMAFFIGNCRDANYKKDFFDENAVVYNVEVPKRLMGRLGNDIFIRPAEITPHFAQDCKRHPEYEEFCRLCYIMHFKCFP